MPHALEAQTQKVNLVKTIFTYLVHVFMQLTSKLYNSIIKYNMNFNIFHKKWESKDHAYPALLMCERWPVWGE
jgi:hypothetical protein